MHAWKVLSLAVLWLFGAVVVTGCASSDVTERRSYARDEKIARPDRIIMYDFAASPADVRANSAIAGRYAQHSTPQTAGDAAKSYTMMRSGRAIFSSRAYDRRSVTSLDAHPVTTTAANNQSTARLRTFIADLQRFLALLSEISRMVSPIGQKR